MQGYAASSTRISCPGRPLNSDQSAPPATKTPSFGPGVDNPSASGERAGYSPLSKGDRDACVAYFVSSKRVRPDV